MSQNVVVGRFAAPYGVQGWIKVISYTQPVDNLLTYQPWLIQLQGTWQPINLEAIEHRGNAIIVKPPGCHDPESVRYYTNREIAVARTQFPPLAPGEYYRLDLIGLQVINQDEIIFGKVESLMLTGANDVLVVNGTRERLIPYLKHVIQQVDLEAGVIRVDWDAAF